MRILLVEDDPMIGEALTDVLHKEAAYGVDWVRDGHSAIQAVTCNPYDLILLDLGLPGMDGLAALKSIRTQLASVPVIIITARDTIEERIMGLDSGADDYLVKPFASSELLARVRAVTRRNVNNHTPLMSNGVITLNPATGEASVTEGPLVQLSNREFALLRALMIRPGTILSRSDLEEKIYGWGEEIESNAVEFIIHGLRKKLGSHAINNVRGLGWLVSKNS